MSGCNKKEILKVDNENVITGSKTDTVVPKIHDSIKIIISTYLGNETRKYYGEDPPDRLNLKWKYFLGKGKSEDKHGNIKEWSGSGWTGQPLLTEENGKLCIYIGALDYHLKKIDAETGHLIWQYKFDDAIKGTGTVFVNSKSNSLREKYSIVQGSKRGYGTSLSSKSCFSLRGVSMIDGSELWRYNVEQTRSASRDVDGTPLVINDTIIAALENGYLAFLDANNLLDNGKYSSPQEIELVPLYEIKNLRRNLIAEGSPALIGNTVYNTCGSGWLYGVNKSSKETTFEYYIGADLNGTPPVTDDSCLLVTVEKEYIQGSGGVLKINPHKNSNDCVTWFFPTGSKGYADWAGGVVGSVSVSGNYCAFSGMDGYLYLADHTKIDPVRRSPGPDLKKVYPEPLLLDKKYIGPSISTPIIVKNRVIACSYNGIYLFEIKSDTKLELLDKFETGIESTPIVWNHCLYVGSRDGYLYCFWK
ncbi:MAG: PQQ-binding-like beta-propeller repeat protein [Ignavibacteria bacterium]|nr:PQQ-binding-like beta-propeller repeat protein [Ignavibacteria bacterium]